ncbi:MAG: ABC transporter ATP-binding protein [Pseudomonadota bacterium]
MVATSSSAPATSGAENNDLQAVLSVRDLQVAFGTKDGAVHAVNGVSFDLKPGELLAIVGESGSGKSVTMMSLLRLLPMPPAQILGGQALFNGDDLLTMDQSVLRKVRGGDIGFIFQDPMTSLNPVFTVGFQIIEPLRTHLGLSKKQAAERAAQLLELVGIPSAKDRLRDYPHQFSGGMRQRVMIAIALACDPKVLIADEATTALDVTVQAQIIEIIKDLREKLGMAIVWITHDLGVVAGIADHVAVMYGGQIVEYASVKDLYANPSHPYTQALLQTLPKFDLEGDAAGSDRLHSIPGQPPSLGAKPSRCSFAGRCPHVMDICLAQNPLLMTAPGQTGGEQKAACFLLDEAHGQQATTGAVVNG